MAQSSGKPLSVGSYTERSVTQMTDRVAGVHPLSVTIVNKKEAIVQLKEDDPIIDVSCVISSKRSLLSIIQEGEEM